MLMKVRSVLMFEGYEVPDWRTVQSSTRSEYEERLRLIDRAEKTLVRRSIDAGQPPVYDNNLIDAGDRLYRVRSKEACARMEDWKKSGLVIRGHVNRMRSKIDDL